MTCKIKLHSKGFYQQILGAVTVLKFLQKFALDFPYICLQFFPGNFTDKCVENFFKRSSSACDALRFFQQNPQELSFSLQFIYCLKQPFYQPANSRRISGRRFSPSEKIFGGRECVCCSQATVLRKLFGVRFSCKHCNFSRVCLLVKMVSKTVTRSFPRGKMNGYVLELCQTFSQPSPRHLLPHIDAQYMKSFIFPAGKSSIEVNLDPADEVGSEQD